MIQIRYKNENEPRMHVHRSEDVVYLTWPRLEELPFIRHAFSTRLGGVSKDYLASMNLSFTRGDAHDNVIENYRRFSNAVGFETWQIVCSDQTHTTNIRIVDEKDMGKGIVKSRDYQDVDGFMTNVPGPVLTTFFADCVPIYLIDPEHQAIALVHSGWRGTVGNIGGKAVKMMGEVYGTKPEEVLAAIGPSICGACYEISKDVADQFQEAYAAEDYHTMMRDDKNGKYHLDLWAACRCNLENSRVRPDHILNPNLCTCCNPDLLFSHRASKGRRGNLAAFLQIIP